MPKTVTNRFMPYERPPRPCKVCGKMIEWVKQRVRCLPCWEKYKAEHPFVLKPDED